MNYISEFNDAKQISVKECGSFFFVVTSSVAKRRQRLWGRTIDQRFGDGSAGYPTRDFSLAISLLHWISLLSRTRKSFLASRQQRLASADAVFKMGKKTLVRIECGRMMRL